MVRRRKILLDVEIHIQQDFLFSIPKIGICIMVAFPDRLPVSRFLRSYI